MVIQNSLKIPIHLRVSHVLGLQWLQIWYKIHVIIQVAVTTASGPEEMTPLSTYLAILRGLERLLLASVLTRQDAEVLVKLSVDR